MWNMPGQLHLTAASGRVSRCPRRQGECLVWPEWLKPARTPRSLDPDPVSQIGLSYGMPLPLPGHAGFGPLYPGFSVVWHMDSLQRFMQISGLIRPKGLADSNLLFNFWHLQGAWPDANKNALPLSAVADTGWIRFPIFLI